MSGEVLRYGHLGIRKTRGEGVYVKGRKHKTRPYFATVFDYSAPDPDAVAAGGRYRKVFTAVSPGWTKKSRQECRDWILASSLYRGQS